MSFSAPFALDLAVFRGGFITFGDPPHAQLPHALRNRYPGSFIGCRWGCWTCGSKSNILRPAFMAVWGSKIPTCQFLDVEMLQGLFWQMGWLTIFDEICTLKPALTIVLLHWCLCPWINRWYCSIRAPVTLSFTLGRVVFWVASGELAAKK